MATLGPVRPLAGNEALQTMVEYGGLPLQTKFGHYLSSDHLSLDHLVGGGVGWGLGQAVGAVGASTGRALQVCFLSLQCHGMDYNFGGGG